MSLFTININYVIDEETKKAILGITKTLKKIMSLEQEINDKLDAAQTTLDTIQGAVTTALDGYKATIADLEAQIASGITPSGAQAILDKLNAITTDLETTQTS